MVDVGASITEPFFSKSVEGFVTGSSGERSLPDSMAEGAQKSNGSESLVSSSSETLGGAKGRVPRTIWRLLNSKFETSRYGFRYFPIYPKSLLTALPEYPLEETVVQLTGPTRKSKRAYRRGVMVECASWVSSGTTDIILLAVLNLYPRYMDGRHWGWSGPTYMDG